jgi:Penicillin-insensitive murein endopeptidase
VLSGSPAEFGKLIADETEKWGKVIRAALIRFLENLALEVHNAGIWNGLLISDMSQPHGGPMSTGHASHQIGSSPSRCGPGRHVSALDMPVSFRRSLCRAVVLGYDCPLITDFQPVFFQKEKLQELADSQNGCTAPDRAEGLNVAVEYRQ